MAIHVLVGSISLHVHICIRRATTINIMSNLNCNIIKIILRQYYVKPIIYFKMLAIAKIEYIFQLTGDVDLILKKIGSTET